MILVTGASGTVGSEVVKQLKAANVVFRIAVSSSYKLAAAKAEGRDAVLFDYTKPETFAAALQGVDKLFLLSPPAATHLEAPLIEAAKKASVKHIVKLSVIGAEGEGYIFAREHRTTEKLIEASGVPYTFLRPNGFMQNYVNNSGESIKTQGAFYLPLADSRVSYVDVRDIAAVAVKALTGTGHENKAYTITGQQALNNAEVAEKIGKVIGKKVNYVPVGDDDLRKAMAGAPKEMVEALVELMHYYKDGKSTTVSGDVERVLGRKPISFDQFAKDHASALGGRAG